MTTSTDLVNRSLATIGTRSQIVSMTDGSQEAQYANILYGGLRDFLLREGDYEFATVVTSPPTIPPAIPWIYAYSYPADCVRVKQLISTGYNPLDPQPLEFNIFDDNAAIPPAKGIATKLPVAFMIYTSNSVIETNWDSMFTEAFVRMLGSSLAFALENRIEASREKLQEAISFAGLASLKDG